MDSLRNDVIAVIVNLDPLSIYLEIRSCYTPDPAEEMSLRMVFIVTCLIQLRVLRFPELATGKWATGSGKLTSLVKSLSMRNHEGGRGDYDGYKILPRDGVLRPACPSLPCV